MRSSSSGAADARPTPLLVERDISTNADWERAFFASIPVVELGGTRVELATSTAKLRALLAQLDATAPAAVVSPGA